MSEENTVVEEAVEEKSAVKEPKAPKTIAKLEEEGDIAADYLEALLDIADLDGDIDIDVENDRASLAIVGGKLRHLVGQEGEVLDSIQELTPPRRTNSNGR
jgi:spoIIIJ-associated protein